MENEKPILRYQHVEECLGIRRDMSHGIYRFSHNLGQCSNNLVDTQGLLIEIKKKELRKENLTVVRN
jgi:hypothetical protein